MFEGNPVGFCASLERLSRLPPKTLVCPAHEYTISNLKFANAVEPNNTDLQEYTQHCKSLRAKDLPTLPTTIEKENSVNPFLRVKVNEVIQSAQKINPTAVSAAEIFATLRSWKNDFS